MDALQNFSVSQSGVIEEASHGDSLALTSDHHHDQEESQFSLGVDVQTDLTMCDTADMELQLQNLTTGNKSED